MAKSDTDETKTPTDAQPSKDDAPAKAAKGDAQGSSDGNKDDESSLDHDKEPLEISLKTFLKACGKKPDQTAGFASFASRELSGRRTQQDWEQAFSDFHAKPLR